MVRGRPQVLVSQQAPGAPCCKCSGRLLDAGLWSRRPATRHRTRLARLLLNRPPPPASASASSPCRNPLHLIDKIMKNTRLLIAAALSAATFLAGAQQAARAPAAGASQAEQPWKYKTKHLGKDEVDALLAAPEKLLLLDLRRPDELIRYGSFPVYLSIQARDLEKHLAYLPKDRAILTVSNHAQRAGAAGDLLVTKGYTIVGAAGSEDYENEGGKAVVHIAPPAPRAASAPRQ
jgi:rhodanese-related sulfurtransferase